MLDPEYLKENVLSILMTGAGILVAYSYIKYRNREFPCVVPFPLNLTVLSDALYFVLTTTIFHGSDPAQMYRSARKRLGDVFYMGPMLSGRHYCPVLVVTHPQDQMAIIKKERELELLVALPETNVAIHGEENLNNLSVGPRHAALRKLFSSLLSPKYLEHFTASMVATFNKMWNDLEQKNEEVHIQTVIQETQFKLMSKLLYGFHEDSEEEKEALEQFLNDFVLTGKARFSPRGKKSTAFKEGKAAKDRIFQVLSEKFDKILQERRELAENGDSNNKDSATLSNALEQIADALIQSGSGKNDGSPGGVSYDDAVGNLYLLLEASQGTTMQMTTNLMFLLNHPDNVRCRERLVDEVNKLSEPTYENLKNHFPYAHGCIQETMRLCPLVGNVPYFIKEGKSFPLREKTVQGPVVVTLNNSHWNRDEDVWPEADTFIPERWLAGNPFEASKFAKSTFHPFGYGRHLCLGYPMAKLAMAANLYCFASKGTARSIVFDEEKFEKIFQERRELAENGGSRNNKNDNTTLSNGLEQIADALIEAGCTGKNDNNPGGVSYDDAIGNLYVLLELSQATTMQMTTNL
eukprot:scaffold13521_cov155-Cylindrotheca_fusiformis.AAC.1